MILIAGPCVLETYDTLQSIVESILPLIDSTTEFYLKASCIKDNRTRPQSYEGPGFKEGIKIFQKIKNNYKNIKICTDFHNPEQINTYGYFFDVIQIPAYLAKQQSLLRAAARSDGIVFVKKPQFLNPKEFIHIVDILQDAGAERIIGADRGTMFGYDYMMDPRNIRFMKESGVPILVDITHPQKYYKGELAHQLAYDLGMSYLAVEADGIFMETHVCPDDGLCDSNSMIPISKIDTFISDFVKINSWINKH